MSEFTWLSVSTVTGQVIAELPDLQCSALEQRMMEEVSLEMSLPYEGAPSNWLEAIEPMSTAILLMQSGNPIPLWGGIVISYKRPLGDATISLKVATWETYLDRCPVGDDTYTQVSQTEIVASLVRKWAITSMRNSLQLDVATSSIKRDDTDHKEADNKSVLSCIQSLSGLENGPEWYIDWQPQGNDVYAPVLHVADHIGSTTPVAMFDTSMMTEFTLSRDWSAGYGANMVRATSTADGDVTPMSSWHTANDPLRPVVKHQFQPSTSIKNVSTLNSHASAMLNTLSGGTVMIEMGLDLLTAPRLGVEWGLGDAVEWNLNSAEQQYPDIEGGVVRFIGWKLDITSSILTPYLFDDGKVM